MLTHNPHNSSSSICDIICHPRTPGTHMAHIHPFRHCAHTHKNKKKIFKILQNLTKSYSITSFFHVEYLFLEMVQSMLTKQRPEGKNLVRPYWEFGKGDKGANKHTITRSSPVCRMPGEFRSRATMLPTEPWEAECRRVTSSEASSLTRMLLGIDEERKQREQHV